MNLEIRWEQRASDAMDESFRVRATREHYDPHRHIPP